jgi:UDP-glucose 4-epimerase
MKKILVTGCSGYIGSHLCHLLKNDYEVYGLDVKLPQVPLKHFYKHDIRDPIDFLRDENFDAVIHLAALVNVSESEKDPVDYYLTNLLGTMAMVDAVDTTNFIFASTGAAEGCASAYGISKRAAEDTVRQMTKERFMEYTTFRFYNVIGSGGFEPTNPDGLFYNLIKARDSGEFTIYGYDYDESPDGTCVRDYVHVMEICDALKQAIEKPANKIECLGHGVGHTVKDIVTRFMMVNECDFLINLKGRRPGDLPVSVLKDVSPYMKNLYTLDELLTVDNK